MTIIYCTRPNLVAIKTGELYSEIENALVIDKSWLIIIEIKIRYALTPYIIFV